jgi:hypothetical protein
MPKGSGRGRTHHHVGHLFKINEQVATRRNGQNSSRCICFTSVSKTLGRNTMMQHYTFVLIVFLGFISGCGEFVSAIKDENPTETGVTGNSQKEVNLVSENLVEAPDIFKVVDMALWDGRPTFGGIWVAHPDVIEPESVLIRIL